MQIHLLGHASIHVQLGSMSVLIDPWLCLDMMEGVCRRFPDPGILNFEIKFPDLVLISHHHWDHVDLPTLKIFPQHTRFLIPQNERLKQILGLLGFNNIQIVEPWEVITLEQGRIIPTPSHVPFGEVGFYFEDANGGFWNLVDTVFEQEDIQRMNTIADGKLLLTLVPSQSYDEMSVLMRQPSRMKGRLTEKNAEAIRHLESLWICPGADGLFYPGKPHLNRQCFLNTPFEMIDAILERRPEQKCMIILPTDHFRLKKGRVELERSLKIPVQDIMDLYADYRSFQAEVVWPAIETSVLTEEESQILHQYFDHFDFRVYPPEIREEFSRLRAVFVLRVPGHLELEIDFFAGTVKKGENLRGNCSFTVSARVLLNMIEGLSLFNIQMQADSFHITGENQDLAYRALDMLYYYGFQEELRLEKYVSAAVLSG